MGGRILVGIGGLALLLTSSRMAEPPESPPAARVAATPASTEQYPTTNTADYIWPTNASRVITSTFGEYRATHFHAGIDISTNERTGYPVHAARDGYVANIAISPTSYGKALTVRHKDGFSTIYMHLERFNKDIQARAEAEQRRLGRYPIDIDCEPDEFPVRQGSTIAYSGNTGSGPAHLHFEVRDANRHPVNPLVFEHFKSRDDIAPTVLKIAFIPLSGHSLINGGWSYRILKPARVPSGSWSIRDTIQVTGDVGLAVSVRDRANDTHHRRGVYAHKLYLDDSLIFSAQLDRLPARAWQQSGLYFDWELRDMGQGKFERLFRDGPSDIPFIDPPDTRAGILSAAQYSHGVHRFTIVSTDFNGNSATLSGHILLSDIPEVMIEANATALTVRSAQEQQIRTLYVFASRNGSPPWSLDRILSHPFEKDGNLRMLRHRDDPGAIKVIAENSFGVKSFPAFQFTSLPDKENHAPHLHQELSSDYVRVVLNTEKPFSSAPSLTLQEGTISRSINLHAVDASTYAGTYRPDESFHGTRHLTATAEVNGRHVSATSMLDLYPIVPGGQGTFRVDNGRLLIAYDSLSVFKTLFLQIDRENSGEEVAYRLQPEYTVLRGGIGVSVRLDPSQNKRGLFFRGRGGRSVLAAATSPGESVLSGRLSRTLGELAVRVDNDPPSVSRLRIRYPFAGRPKISFGFSDNLAGIEYNELKMYIDGDAVIPEIDGEHGRASYQMPRPLKRGTHLLVIHLADRLGNSSTQEKRFTVR
jgi:hypothetical protein